MQLELTHFTNNGPSDRLPTAAKKRARRRWSPEPVDRSIRERLGRQRGKVYKRLSRTGRPEAAGCFLPRGTELNKAAAGGAGHGLHIRIPGPGPELSGWARPQHRSTGPISTISAFGEQDPFTRSQCTSKYRRLSFIGCAGS